MLRFTLAFAAVCCLSLSTLAQEQPASNLQAWWSSLVDRQGQDTTGSGEWQASPIPSWLSRRAAGQLRLDLIRDALQIQVRADYNEVRLKDVLQDIATQAGFEITIQATELDLIGVSPDTNIAFGPASESAENVLRLVLDPLELAFVSRASGVIVTSKDAAGAEPVLRYYDMAWVLPTAAQSKSLVDAIELTIDPDSWLLAGGTSRIQLVGSIMVVSAPDSTQGKIEDLYANLLRLRGKAGRAATNKAPPEHQH